MHSIDKAPNILEENIGSIHNITEWAYKMGYKKLSRFSWEFRDCHGIRPSEIFIEKRVKCVIDYMKEHPKLKNYCICKEFGFANEKALYKFLKRHTGQSPTQLRKGITKRDSNSIGLNLTDHLCFFGFCKSVSAWTKL